MIHSLTISKTGKAIPDHQAEVYAAQLINKSLRVSTENIIHAARAMIKRGVLDHKTIEFCVENDGIVVCTEHCDETGRMNNFWSHFDTHFGFVQKWYGELL